MVNHTTMIMICIKNVFVLFFMSPMRFNDEKNSTCNNSVFYTGQNAFSKVFLKRISKHKFNIHCENQVLEQVKHLLSSTNLWTLLCLISSYIHKIINKCSAFLTMMYEISCQRVFCEYSTCYHSSNFSSSLVLEILVR